MNFLKFLKIRGMRLIHSTLTNSTHIPVLDYNQWQQQLSISVLGAQNFVDAVTKIIKGCGVVTQIPSVTARSGETEPQPLTKAIF